MRGGRWGLEIGCLSIQPDPIVSTRIIVVEGVPLGEVAGGAIIPIGNIQPHPSRHVATRRNSIVELEDVELYFDPCDVNSTNWGPWWVGWRANGRKGSWNTTRHWHNKHITWSYP
jgi:hypothetical protein